MFSGKWEPMITENDNQSWALPFSVEKPLSVDTLINGTVFSFRFLNVNLSEERLFLNLNKTSAFEIKCSKFCLITKRFEGSHFFK
jgi:hypothetical protein